MGFFYRLQQLRNIVTAGPLSAAASAEIHELLSDAEFDLFFHFTYADQWHSYRVLRTLQDAGYNQPELLTAALMHDIGKVSSPLSVWDRTMIVVGSALFPKRVDEWGRGSVDSWRRPFVARAQHPAWGADMAAAAGSRPGAVELIRRHQDKLITPVTEIDQLLGYLQWADDRN